MGSRTRRPLVRGRRVWVLRLAISAVVGVSGCGGGLPANVAVQVAGTPITKAAVDHWMSVSASLAPPVPGLSPREVPDPPVYRACIASLARAANRAYSQSTRIHAYLSQCASRYAALKRQALEFLISTQWIVGEADELGVTLSPAELRQQVHLFESHQASTPQEFSEFLNRTGETAPDVILQAKVAGLTPKLPQKVERDSGPVPHAQVLNYYRDNPQRFRVPEKRDIKIVRLVSETAAQRTEREIQTGTTFATIARRLALAEREIQLGRVHATQVEEASYAQPIDTHAGLLLGLTPGFFSEKTINDAIFTAPLDVLRGPVRISLGYYIFEVKKIRSAHLRPFSQVQGEIAQELTARRRQQALRIYRDQFRSRWIARTDCRAGYVVASCR
jgi:foldase protein PrsA